jgi:hypothetical protein
MTLKMLRTVRLGQVEHKACPCIRDKRTLFNSNSAPERSWLYFHELQIGRWADILQLGDKQTKALRARRPWRKKGVHWQPFPEPAATDNLKEGSVNNSIGGSTRMEQYSALKSPHPAF